jgi:hypothetical protein
VRTPIDSTNSEAENKVKADDYKDALNFCADSFTDNSPSAEEAEDGTGSTD